MDEDSIHEDFQKVGILKVIKFGKSKLLSNEYAVEKSDLIKVESDLNTTIVKIEFTLTSCIILLSNGKVLSRGKIQDFTLGREANIETVKKFKQISFMDDRKLNSDEVQEIFIYNISTGDNHVLALDNEMRLWGWGKNDQKQINPKSKLDEIKFPQLIATPSDAKIIQIYALNSTSMIICRNNIVYMWGSNKENFLGDVPTPSSTAQTTKGEEKIVGNFTRMDKLTNFIVYEMRKNDKQLIEGFVNSRKLFNSKYNITLEDSINKNFRIEKLNNQIVSLKNEIKKYSNINSSPYGTKLKSSDKRILLLQDLLKNYESKLSALTIQKEALRKDLIAVEADINKKETDMKGNTAQIDQVEDQIEQLNNEINSIKFKSKNNEALDNSEELINERLGKINNLNIYKDSLSTNLQIIINYLEAKDKDRYEKSKTISDLITSENECLKAKFILEDMIQIIFESTNYINNKNEEVNDKDKDKYNEYFKFSEKIDDNSFLRLNKRYPYMIVNDIVNLSDNNIANIKKDYETHKQNLSDFMKDKLNVIINMIDTKLELTKEQNSLIKCLYSLFGNLENEIKKKAEEIDKESSKIFSDSKGKHIEYIYKEMIINYLKEVYKQDDLTSLLPSRDEMEKNKIEKEKYLKEKQEEVRTLEARELIEKCDSKIDFSSLICFDYDN